MPAPPQASITLGLAPLVTNAVFKDGFFCGQVFPVWVWFLFSLPTAPTTIRPGACMASSAMSKADVPSCGPVNVLILILTTAGIFTESGIIEKYNGFHRVYRCLEA